MEYRPSKRLGYQSVAILICCLNFKSDQFSRGPDEMIEINKVLMEGNYVLQLPDF
jgi:hypothetical protein